MLFYKTLLEFLQGLEACFPEHEGVKSTSQMLSSIPANGMMDNMLASGWYDATKDVKDAIRGHDAEAVVKAFEESGVDMLKSIDVRPILLPDEPHDEETNTNIWLFITTLSDVSDKYVQKTETQSGELPNEANAAPKMPAPGTKPTSVPQQTKKQPDINNLVEGFTAAMPKVVQSLNQVLKSEDGKENPLGDLIRGMMAPQGQGLQPGMTNNIMANMLGDDDGTVMQEAAMANGLTVEEITQKLQRLDQYERLRAAKKKKRSGN